MPPIDPGRMPNKPCIKDPRSRKAVLVAIVACLLNATPARATFTFNVNRLSLAAEGAGDLVELAFSRTGSPIGVAEAVSQIQSSIWTNVDRTPIVNLDLLAVNFVSSQSQSGLLSTDLGKVPVEAGAMDIDFSAPGDSMDKPTPGQTVNHNSMDFSFRSPPITGIGGSVFLLVVFTVFGERLLTHFVVHRFRAPVAVKVSSRNLDVGSKRETKHVMDRFR